MCFILLCNRYGYLDVLNTLGIIYLNHYCEAPVLFRPETYFYCYKLNLCMKINFVYELPVGKKFNYFLNVLVLFHFFYGTQKMCAQT